mgnify:CR=1 FL=1
MDLIPVRIMGHVEKDNTVILQVPKFSSKFFHRIFPRSQQMFYRIKLDKLGSVTWLKMNGDRNVQEIASIIRQSDFMNKEELLDLEIRLNKFMSQLYEQRYITFKQLLQI